MANPLDYVTQPMTEDDYVRSAVQGDASMVDPNATVITVQPENSLSRKVTQPENPLAAMIQKFRDYVESINVVPDPTSPTGEFNSVAGVRRAANEAYDRGTGNRLLNKITGAGGEERFQFWPERMVRSGVSLPRDVATGEVQMWDPRTGHTSEQAIERAQDTAGLAGGSTLFEKPGVGTLGSGPMRRTKMELKPAPVFYSALEHAVTNAAQDTMSPQQWAGWLKNQPGLKAEEMQWTGLGDWLAGQKDKVSKADVQRYLDEHKVEIKQITKGGNSEIDLVDTLPNDRLKEAFYNYDEELGHPSMMSREYLKSLVKEGDLSRSDLKAFDDWVVKNPETASTKYENYQLPGGENYREHLLTLPRKQNEPLAGKYQSSHWDEPNVLAHVRTNDRDVAGKPSLHLEEIQSDWHQAGRKEGYTPNLEEIKRLSSEVDAAEKALRDVYDALPDRHRPTKDEIWSDIEHIRKGKDPIYINPDGARSLIDDYRTKFEAHERAIGGNVLMGRRGTVPDAPFKTSWAELALKRMIRMAAEEGKDRISWTPGEAQAARYDLSKNVGQVILNDPVWHGENDIRGNLVITGKANGNDLVSEPVKSKKEIEKYIGKEATEALVNNPTSVQGRDHILKGDGLKVGGEGMKGFYDDILPKTIEKLGKKYGVKVHKGETGTKGISKTVDDRYSVTGDSRVFDTLDEAKKAASQPVYYFDIPPAWKDQALSKGFPLFTSGIPFPLKPVDYNPFTNKDAM